MKKTLLVLSIVLFFALLSTTVFVYAQMGYRSPMGGMMDYNHNNENYQSNNYTLSKLSKNAAKGKVLFESLCAQCHGINAQGRIGPNIQGTSSNNIEWALKNVSMMGYLKSNPKLKDTRNIRYISDFLKSIK